MSKKATEIDEYLMNMKGKTFQYAGHIHFVQDFEVDEIEQKFTIKTNLNTFTRFFDSFENFLQYWTEARQINGVQKVGTAKGEVVFMQEENSLANKLIEILQDNITKVQKDAGYIEQAKAINNNVNSIINVAKLKIDLIKQSKNHR